MNKLEAMADSLYEKMSDYCSVDHKEHCVKNILIPWLKDDEKVINRLKEEIEILRKELEEVDNNTDEISI